MASKVWCLLIDHDHKPIFGEPFPVTIHHEDTIHDLKIKLRVMWESIHFAPNEVEIWKCKTSKLSANDSFTRMKKQLGGLNFDGDENSDAEHLGVARMVMALTGFNGFQQGELFLAVVICRNGT
jgi:hypothetical protein